MKTIIHPIRIVSIAALLGGLWLLPLPASAQENSEPGLLERLDVELHGFADVRAGTRIKSDPNEKQNSLGEARL